MPIYELENPESGEIIEIVQSMKDDHSYTSPDGVEWRRVFTSPNSSIDTRVDGSLESFMRKTENKKGTFGDLWDASREASEARTKSEGKDSVKEKHFKNYSAKRNGMKHQNDTNT